MVTSVRRGVTVDLEFSGIPEEWMIKEVHYKRVYRRTDLRSELCGWVLSRFTSEEPVG